MKGKSTFQKTMEGSAVVLGLLTPVLFAVYHLTNTGLFETLAITSLTFFYHFASRLLIGAVVPAIAEKCRLDPESCWFRQKSFEKKLYKRLKVKNWKDKMPTYSPDTFSLEKHSLDEIVRSTCVSELVHEVIVVFSFVPLLFSLVWGTFAVFLITSVIAAVFDCSFVIMQRYNRPRLVRLLGRKQTADS